MEFLAEARRRAFSQWLRTGRLPKWLTLGHTEFKFNPWHDPDDGRFTFAGTGTYFGDGRRSARASTARHSDERRQPSAPVGGGHSGGGRGRGGGRGSEGSGAEPFGGFGGGNGPGGGASGSWNEPAPKPGTQASPYQAGQSEGNPANAPDSRANVSRAIRSRTSAANWRRVTTNGYDFWVDANGDGIMIEGVLKTDHTQPRSRTAQRQAGGPDRRDSDDGGHYVARRFNGPTDAFNHFAQNSNFNRGRYRALEDELARAERAGQKVEILILPVFEGSSRRPIEINVWFWIDGKRRSAKFLNEPRETTGAKR